MQSMYYVGLDVQTTSNTCRSSSRHTMPEPRSNEVLRTTGASQHCGPIASHRVEPLFRQDLIRPSSGLPQWQTIAKQKPRSLPSEIFQHGIQRLRKLNGPKVWPQMGRSPNGFALSGN